MKDDMFFRARLKLTGLFTAGIVLILMIFSLGVYLMFEEDLAGELVNEEELGQEENEYQELIVDEAISRLLVILIVADTGAVILVVGVSWFLAGRALAPIRTSLERQKRFVSDAAHELRTPLSIMKAGLETVGAAGEPSAGDYRKLNEDLLEETERVISLANDLLFLSRSDQSSLTDERVDIDISALCARQVELMRPYALQGKVELSQDIQPGLGINGAEAQVERLVRNLLKNSIDHNREGGRSILTLSRDGDRVILEIADGGPGMSRQELEHVFDRFYKADRARQRTEAGAGLGLSIVREIVRLHDGEITIESEIGAGTRVTVAFRAAA